MAAVTVNSLKRNVSGSLREFFYNLTGTTGDTLTVGLNTVNMVNSEGGAITAYSVAAGTIPGTSIITLTGTISAMDLQVIGN